jgi:hypothetical protein
MQGSRKLEDPSQAKLEERSFGATRSFIASRAGTLDSRELEDSSPG